MLAANRLFSQRILMIVVMSLGGLAIAAAPTRPGSSRAMVFMGPPAPSSASSPTSLLDMATQLGPFSTDYLPKLQPLPDLGLRLDIPAWQVREALGAKFGWGKHEAAAGDGLLICDILENTDAAKTDIVPGDVLIAIDFGAGGLQPLNTMEDFDLAMTQIRPGDVVRLVLFRRGAQRSMDVRCGEWDTVLDPLPDDGVSRHVLAWEPMGRNWVEGQRLECLKDFRLKHDAMALKDRADLSLIHAQYAAASKDYGEFIAAWPDNAKPYPALFGRAYALRQAGQTAEAEKALREAAKAPPDSIAVKLEQIELLLAQKHSAQARQRLKELERTLSPRQTALWQQEFWPLELAFMDEETTQTLGKK